VGRLAAAGADTFVAGNAVFTAEDPTEEVRALRRLATDARSGIALA
jgi:pentose-5-phosphate-3-epimerase